MSLALRVLGLSVLLGSALDATVALAESAAPPDVGTDADVCSYTELAHTSPPGGDVPANWPWFVIHLSPSSGVLPEQAQLIRRSDGSTVPSTTGVTSDGRGILLTPLEPLVEGETYDLVHPVCMSLPMESTTYLVTAPLPTPASLGTLTATPVRAWYAGSGQLLYGFYVTLTPDPALEPWRALYSLSSTPFSSVYSDTFSFSPRCGCHPGEFPTGTSTIRVTATPIEGSGPVWTASTDAVVDCEGAVIFDPFTGEPATQWEIAYYANGRMDVGADGMDAGVHTSAACEPPLVHEMDGGPPTDEMDGGLADASHEVDGGRMGMHTEPDTHSNCGCHIGGREEHGGVLPLVIAGWAVARRVRNRRRRRV